MSRFGAQLDYSLLARKTKSPQHVSRLVDRLMGAASGASVGPVNKPGPHDVRRD